MVVHLALFELRLLLRKRITAVSVLAVPIGVCALAWLQYRGMAASEWPSSLGFTATMMLLFSVFLVSTTVFTARRQSLVLQRLRTSELSDNGVFAGVSVPIMLVGLVQLVVFFAFCIAIGAPSPSRPLFVLLGLILGLVLALLAGIATAAFSRSVEVTQITAMPVLLAGMAGMFMVPQTDSVVSTIGTLLPFAGIGELITKGWAGSTPSLALASSLVWLLILGFTAARYFKWEPRQ
ncbi:ABC-2 type transport system permease protein [Kibdelosporangium banguiense]|uniref:ABC-2 type transport system permease protein n=1 Tax=Kibdelosporangium banguiense TaxID=1365924 RepID=A0ABS4TDE8_9PSEU|nr:ABC transporter permease [Kibdelosporangium banguiense]MBP2322452.1 ABC-2 type transport system permease protein [Kibdelosporangium banguiense]